MDTTPHLALPYIAAAQAQKHVTHNEAIRALDAVVQLSVKSRGLTAPPDPGQDGTRYIIDTPATGDWSGHEDEIVAWQDNSWMFYAPQEGWLCWVADEAVLVVWDGSGWQTASDGRRPVMAAALLSIQHRWLALTQQPVTQTSWRSSLMRSCFPMMMSHPGKGAFSLN